MRIRVRRAAVLLVSLAATVTAYSDRDRRALSAAAERPWDVIAQVDRTEFGPGFDWKPKSVTMTAGPELEPNETRAQFTVGPMTLHTTDGRSLAVPPGTPGANACIELMNDEMKLTVTGMAAPDGLRDENVRASGPRNMNCVIVADLADDNTVVRFEVLEGRRGLALAGKLVAARKGGFLTGSGFVFPIALDVDVACTDPTQKPEELAGSDQHHEALIDPKRAAIVRIQCLYDN